MLTVTSALAVCRCFRSSTRTATAYQILKESVIATQTITVTTKEQVFLLASLDHYLDQVAQGPAQMSQVEGHSSRSWQTWFKERYAGFSGYFMIRSRCTRLRINPDESCDYSESPASSRRQTVT